MVNFVYCIISFCKMNLRTQSKYKYEYLKKLYTYILYYCISFCKVLLKIQMRAKYEFKKSKAKANFKNSNDYYFC